MESTGRAEENDDTVIMGDGAIPTEAEHVEAEESPSQEEQRTVEPPEVESSSASEPSSTLEPSPALKPEDPVPPIEDANNEVSKESEQEDDKTAPQTEPDSSSSAETDIVLALMGWCRAWNNNNVNEYLEAYDPNATYISESLLRAKVTKDDIVLRGKTSISKLFRKVFGSGETTLRYSQIQVELMGKQHASVFGRFTLTMKNNKVADTGVFTLCLVKTEYGVWKIQSEHSSSSLAPLKKK